MRVSNGLYRLCAALLCMESTMYASISRGGAII